MHRRTFALALCVTTLAASALAVGACGGGSDDDANTPMVIPHATATTPAGASATSGATQVTNTTTIPASATASTPTTANATASPGAATTTASSTAVPPTATKQPAQPTPVPPTTAPPTPAGPMSASVGVSETGIFLFTPANITIATGGTVSFAWSGTTQFHDVTFDDGPSSGDPAKSGSFSRTFNSPGAYHFECTVHAASRPPMVGTVTVK